MFQLFVVLPISWKLEAVDRTLLDGVLSLGYEVEKKKKKEKILRPLRLYLQVCIHFNVYVCVCENAFFSCVYGSPAL